MSNNLNAKSLLSILLILLITPSVFLALPATNQDQFDVFYYEINISIDPQTEVVDGSVTIQAISEIDGLTHLTLDLYDNMKTTAVAGQAAGFTHANHILEINLDRAYQRNELISATVFYHGHPSSGSNFNPMTFNRSRGTVTISSESCPYYARCWWPCKDRPDDKPDSMDVKITVPSNLIVASNGVLIEIRDNKNGTKTHHWQIRNPIATYLVSFTASDYKIIVDKYIHNSQDTLSIMHFVYPEHYNMALVDFNNLNEMIRILEFYYGKYPYYNEKYSVAEYVGYWGGMEYQTLTSVQPYFIRGDHTYDGLFVHELAHQWWGDCVTPKDFHHSWISEGFAQFTEALYFGHLEGAEKYRNYMVSDNNALAMKGIMYRHDISDPDVVYDLIVYNKGAWVVHMLRHVVGDANFFAGLQEYRSRFEYGSATTEDLQHAFESVTGDSLGWFFHQWVYEPNYPHYWFGWQQVKIRGQYNLFSFIEQAQTDAPLFTMPVDLTITTENLDSTFVVTVDDSLEKLHYVFPDSIINFQFDRNDWILKKLDIITTPIFQYIDHQIIDTTGNNNGIADPGETISMVIHLVNKGTKTRKIKAWLTSSDPSLEIPHTFYTSTLLTEDYNTISNDIEITLPFAVNPGTPSHLAAFRLFIEDENDHTSVDSFDVKIGTPTILLVDDDNGANYEHYFNQPMALLKIYSDTWEVSSRGVPAFANALQKYQTVIWFTGDDRASSLTRDEQQALAEYLDHGGWLVLTGQNIGYDLLSNGTSADSAFYKNYLHADLVADSVKSTMLIGASGDPIGNGLFVYIDPKAAGGAHNQLSPSAILPRDGAKAFLKYMPQQSAAGIRFMNEKNGSRLVYLAFGFEGISGPQQDTALKLLNRILNWLSGITAVNEFDENDMPSKYELDQNYPNPFNTMTRIRYQLPQTDNVELTIYNLTGQRIKTLVNKGQFAGIYESTWDGTNSSGTAVASGVYIYHLVTKAFACSKKIALIK